MSEKITMDGQYTYRNGEPARVLCVDAPGTLPVITLKPNGDIVRHQAGGEGSTLGRGHDLIKVEPFRRGEVVMVRNDTADGWKVRVFHSENGHTYPYRTFVDLLSCTSWRQCRRPEPGELEMCSCN